MSIAEIPMNLTGLTNITSPSLSVVTNPENIFQQIVNNANTYTSHWLGFFMLLSISFILYWSLSDRSPFGDFKYDDMRALSISLGIASIIGVKGIELGLIMNFVTVAQFTYLFLISLIFIFTYENKE